MSWIVQIRVIFFYKKYINSFIDSNTTVIIFFCWGGGSSRMGVYISPLVKKGKLSMQAYTLVRRLLTKEHHNKSTLLYKNPLIISVYINKHVIF